MHLTQSSRVVVPYHKKSPRVISAEVFLNNNTVQFFFMGHLLRSLPLDNHH